MSDVFNLKGKTALVTGSSRGLGQVIAGGLAEAGVTVLLNGRNETELQKQVEVFNAKGYTADYACFDISEEEQVKEGIRLLYDKYRIDILVNNAGIQIRNPLEIFDFADWNRIIETNLTGAFLVSREVAKSMIRQKSGKIINMGSLQCEVSRPGIAPYAAAKGGLKMLTRAMAVEWARHNIQVNAIGPGYFITDMTLPLKQNAEFDEWITKRTPAARWGNPEELIGTVVYLASDASSFINGQIIYVDGGVLASL